MGVGNDQLHPGQAAGDQPAQERQPPGAVFGGGDVQAEDFPVPISVHPGREQGVHVDHPAVLADFHRESVDPHERVGAGLERAGPERSDLGIEVGGHLADLRARQRLDPELLGQLLHPPGRDPEQIRGRDDSDQGLLGPAAMGE
jgi:collagen type II alpha